MNFPFEAGVVQVKTSSTSGTGFVLSIEKKLIVTCSHVIQENQKYGVQPPNQATIVFRANGEVRTATVLKDHWYPIEKGDVAVLEVDGELPAGVHSLQLGSARGTLDHIVRSCGYPSIGNIQGMQRRFETHCSKVLLLGGLSRDRDDTMQSNVMYGEDKFAEVDGYRIHYVDVGAGDPVILVPGSYSTYRAWNRVIPLLSEHYRLLALDYVGTGDSDKPPKGFRYSIQEQAILIAGLIKQLELGRVHLIGSSYGGAIVLYLAARYPELVEKVVSIEGGIVKPQALPGSPLEFVLKYPVLGDLFLGFAKTGLLNGVLIRWIAGQWYPHMTVDDKREQIEQIRHNARSASRIAWYWISIAHKTCEDFEEAAKTMQMPILYLYGTASDFAEPLLKDNILFLETYLPHARVVGLDDGIHDLEFQKPKEVVDLVLDFLSL